MNRLYVKGHFLKDKTIRKSTDKDTVWNNLLSMYKHSKAQANKIVRFIGSTPTRFKKLVEVFIGGPYRVTQRAAWPLRYCVEDHPDLIKPHITQILNQLRKRDIHDAVKRNVLRILQFVQIPEKNYGLVTELCFRFLQDTKQPVAVRVFSMTVYWVHCQVIYRNLRGS